MKVVIEFFSNGNVRMEGAIRNGKKEGEWKFFFERGGIQKIEYYKNDLLSGVFKRWNENGKLVIEGEYLNGKHSGKWNEYYESGLLKEQGYYSGSEFKVANFWNENGEQILKDGTGYKIEKFGALELDVYKQYFDNFTCIKEEKISSLNIIRDEGAPPSSPRM